jgi:hypothetical protein
MKIQPSYVRFALELLVAFDIAGANVEVRVRISLRETEFAFRLC